MSTYPTDKQLHHIEDWYIPKQGLQEFIYYIQSLWSHPFEIWTDRSWGYRIYRSWNHSLKKSIMVLSVSTEEKPVNKAIISSMKQNRYFWDSFWVSSHQGGHYRFEFPLIEWNANIKKELIEEDTFPFAPRGQTCHFEHKNGKYYIVWSADFPGDTSGGRQLSPKEITSDVKKWAIHIEDNN